MTRPERREAALDPSFLEDLIHWTRTDRKRALRTLKLVDAVLRDPFDGIGKPNRSVGNFPVDGHAGSMANTAWSTR